MSYRIKDPCNDTFTPVQCCSDLSARGVHEIEVKVLIGITGSVAAIKAKQLIERIKQLKPDALPNLRVAVKVVVTENSRHFLNIKEISLLAPVFCDSDEWETWKQMSDPVLHIELRRWADIMILAPLDANTLAKLANGICDNLLTCIVRAWDSSKPLLFCPAMNTYMWKHPLSLEQVQKLKSFNYIEIPCIAKTLACGDIGLGAMAEVDTIVQHVAIHMEQISKRTTKEH